MANAAPTIATIFAESALTQSPDLAAALVLVEQERQQEQVAQLAKAIKRAATEHTDLLVDLLVDLRKFRAQSAAAETLIKATLDEVKSAKTVEDFDKAHDRCRMLDGRLRCVIRELEMLCTALK